MDYNALIVMLRECACSFSALNVTQNSHKHNLILPLFSTKSIFSDKAVSHTYFFCCFRALSVIIFIYSFINDTLEYLRLCTIQWQDDHWIINWKGCGKKWTWPLLKDWWNAQKTLIIIAYILVEIPSCTFWTHVRSTTNFCQFAWYSIRISGDAK
jgi:hypothetical protein